MTATDWDRTFFESTRGRIVDVLRRGHRTVREISAELGLATNTVRTHLTTLEHDGLVSQLGTRRCPGAGKPAHVFGLAPETELRFSNAYVPFLQALLRTLAEGMDRPSFDALMVNVGRRLSPEALRADASSQDRLDAATRIIEGLGGLISSTRCNGSIRIEGPGCPLAAIVTERPEVCNAVQALLSRALGTPVRATCVHNGRPACRFETVPVTTRRFEN